MSLPHYSRYKDSGVDWLGEVPEHWQVLPLKRVAKLITGITPPTEVRENYAEESGFPWVRPEDIDESGKPTVATKFLSDEGKSLIRRVGANSSLICCIGTIGKVGFVTEIVSTNQQITSAEFDGYGRYYFFVIASARVELEVSATGNVLRILNGERLGAIKIPSPSINEQTAIAKFLDRETAKIDALISEQEKLITLLTEKRQATISQAVTKGLNPNAPMKDSGVEWLGAVPEHWECRTVAKVSTKITNGYVGPTRDILVEAGVPYIQATHIKNGCVNFDGGYFVTQNWSHAHSKSILSNEDVLIVQTGAGTGDVGIVTESELGFNCHALIIVAPDMSLIRGTFLGAVLQSSYGQQKLESIQTGAMHPHLNCGEVKFLEIPLPPLSEQIDIVGHINRVVRQFDNLTAEAIRGIALLKERRSALISAAVTGKIDVRQAVQQEQIKIQEAA
jgi:type I restriction enzyme S subunit